MRQTVGFAGGGPGQAGSLSYDRQAHRRKTSNCIVPAPPWNKRRGLRMSWKPTGILAGLAVLLFAFIFFVERRIPTGVQPLPRLVAFRANEVTNIQLRITNQLALRVERTGPTAPWVLTLPSYYPAQPFKIQWMIEVLESLVSDIEISEQELKASKRTVAEFGLDVPRATLTLQHNGRRTEVLFGGRTPVGNGVYIQTSERPGIY